MVETLAPYQQLLGTIVYPECDTFITNDRTVGFKFGSNQHLDAVQVHVNVRQKPKNHAGKLELVTESIEITWIVLCGMTVIGIGLELLTTGLTRLISLAS